MALEFGETGIRINAVGPGVTRTSLTERYFQEAEMAETEEEEDLLLEQHRAFVPGDDREAAEATPYWADAVALLEKHKRARAAGEQLAERADHERALGRFGEALVDLEHFVKRGKMETAGGLCAAVISAWYPVQGRMFLGAGL